jgi:tetratricopeptide (TPR) repeat protein
MGAELPELPEIHEIHHHAHGDRFGRAIAIVTVLATLCGAWTAVLQANAIRHHDEAAATAQELSAETLGVRSTAEGAARVQLERFELAEQQRARAALARQELLFSAGGRARELRIEERRWESIAEQTDRQSEAIAKQDDAEPLKADSEFGPSTDPTFPLRYLAQSRRESYVLAAERAGANRKAARAENQYTKFAVSFTMLAIAVFLFGYSLTPHGRPRRRLFAGTASIFVAVAATNALVTSLNPPKAPPRAAAEAYAEGQVAADSSKPHQAVEHFTQAIKLDSGFADAYVARAEALFLESAPQALGSGASVTTPDALVKVIADERKARSLGIKDPLFYSELGSDLLSLGLHRHDKGNLKDAANLLRKAAHQAEGDASTTYDLGATLTALGRYKDAAAAFHDAVERTMFVEQTENGKTKREPRDDAISEEQDLSVGLEDLQNVADLSGGDVAKHADAFKNMLVEETGKQRTAEAVAAGEEPKPAIGHNEETAPAGEGAAQLQGVKVSLTPQATFFEIPKQAGFDKTKDHLTVQWYFQDPKRLGWTALSEVSRIAEPPVPPGADPTYHERGYYLSLTSPAACLPRGQYRLEIYVNGHPAATVASKLDVQRTAASLRGLGAGLCLPDGWKQSARRMPGLVDGYLGQGGGAYVLSLSPALIGAGAKASATEAGDVLDRVLVRFRDLLPAKPTNGRAGGPAIANLEGALVRTYRVGSARMLAGIGHSSNGQLLVDLVYGPPALFADGTAQSIFGSLSDRT